MARPRSAIYLLSRVGTRFGHPTGFGQRNRRLEKNPMVGLTVNLVSPRSLIVIALAPPKTAAKNVSS
jgi:hypothetical protein